MRFIKSSLLFFFLLLCLNGFGQRNTLSEQTAVSVITCGIGNEVYSLFGHTAIRIFDPVNALDVVYNYGAFDFDTPNFVVKFSKGDLQYFVTAGSFADFQAQYVYEKRAVSEQVLNLSTEQKQQLFDELNITLFSEKRFYTYKFIDRNCTSMVVDILNKTLKQPVIVKKGNTDQTYREVLYPYFSNHFYEQLGTSIIFGTKVDQKATQIFLPSELEQSLAVVQYNGKPLANEKESILQIEPEQPFSWWNNVFTFLILLILLVTAKSKVMTVFYFVIAGLIGLFFSVAGWYSFHGELEYNYNILLFNPVLLVLVVLMLRNHSRWIFRISLFAIGCIGIYIVVMLNKIHLLIVSPLILAHLVLLSRLALANKPQKIRQ